MLKERCKRVLTFSQILICNELEASFMYEDTPDQLKATVDVKKAWRVKAQWID